MKKFIIIAAFFAFGCSNEESDNVQGCKCDAVFTTAANPGNYFIVNGMPTDCNGNVTQSAPGNPEAIFVRCED